MRHTIAPYRPWRLYAVGMDVSPSGPPSPGSLRLGPSVEDLWHIFHLPGGGALLGGVLLVLGLTMTDERPNIAIILGAIMLGLSVLLIALECREIKHPVLSWDDRAMTWGDGGSASLTVPWAEVGNLRLHEITVAHHRRRADRQLWLELRPVNWKSFTKAHKDADDYASSYLPDYAIGLRASRGRHHCRRLDKALTAAGLPCHLSPTTSRIDPPPLRGQK